VVEDNVRDAPAWGIWDRDDARTGLESVWLFFRDLPPAIALFDVIDLGGSRIGDESLDARGVWLTEVLVDDVFEASLSDAAADAEPDASCAEGRRFRAPPREWVASAMPVVGLVVILILEML